jgi:S1-C subfamily serine protease
MVYNSWLNMQANGEKDPDTCAYNDIALVKLDPADAANVDPSIPFWGGPTGVATTSPAAGDTVYSYGNSELRGGLSPLSPKYGKLVQNDGGGWTHTVYTATPGIPGDSGSAFLNSNGQALGVLSTVAIAPLAGSNNVSDLGRMLTYMHAHGGPGANVVEGTPFSPVL